MADHFDDILSKFESGQGIGLAELDSTVSREIQQKSFEAFDKRLDAFMATEKREPEPRKAQPDFFSQEGTLDFVERNPEKARAIGAIWKPSRKQMKEILGEDFKYSADERFRIAQLMREHIFPGPEPMSLAERGLKQFVNDLILRPAQQLRPSVSMAKKKDEVSKTLRAFKNAGILDDNGELAGDNLSVINLVKTAIKTKFSPSENKHLSQALKQYGDWLIDVPEAKGIAEKATDVTAGLGAFVLQVAALKKIIPSELIPGASEKANVIANNLSAWEIQNRITGGPPGQGLVMGAGLQALHGIPAKTWKGALAKIAAESGAFAGITAAGGGDAEDMLISALIPPLFAGYREVFRKRLRSAKTLDELTGVTKDAVETLKGFGELRKFVAMAPEENLARLREHHAQRYEGNVRSQAIVDLIDARMRGEDLLRPVPKPQPQPKKEPTDAGTIRSDTGQARETGLVPERREDLGRQDIQRPPEARPEARGPELREAQEAQKPQEGQKPQEVTPQQRRIAELTDKIQSQQQAKPPPPPKPAEPQVARGKLAPLPESPPTDETAYISAKETREAVRKNYFDKGGKKIASSREKPADWGGYEFGAWRIDDRPGIYGREIEQLRMVPVAELDLPEGDYTDLTYNPEGRGSDAQRYAKWAKEKGPKSIPPVLVIETESGKLRVGDGHRRVAAAKIAGLKEIPAWVSPAMDTGKRTPEGKPIYTSLTYEGTKFGPKRANEMYEEGLSKLKAEARQRKPTEKPSAKQSKTLTLAEEAKKLGVKIGGLKPEKAAERVAKARRSLEVKKAMKGAHKPLRAARKAMREAFEEHRVVIQGEDPDLLYPYVDEVGNVSPDESKYRPGYEFRNKAEAQEVRDLLPKKLHGKIKVVETGFADGADIMVDIGPQKMAEAVKWYAENEGFKGRARQLVRTADFILKNPEQFPAEQRWQAAQFKALSSGDPEIIKAAKGAKPQTIEVAQLSVGDKIEIAGEPHTVIDTSGGNVAIEDSGPVIDIPKFVEITIDKGSLKKGKPEKPKKRPGPKIDLLGQPIPEGPATGEQTDFPFGANIKGEEVTEGGVITKTGKFKPDVSKQAEKQMAAELKESGQMTFGEQARKKADEGESPETLGAIAPSPLGKRRADRISVPDALRHPDPQVEDAMQVAHGIPEKTYRDKIKEILADALHMATRPQKFIPKTPQFAAANDIIRRSKDIRQRASEEAIRDVAAILDPLGKKQKVLFERKLIAENQIASYERGEPLRFNSKEVKQWQEYSDRLDEVIRNTPEVKQSLETREKVVRELVEKLVDAELLPPAALDNAKQYYHQQVLSYVDVKRSFGKTGRKRGLFEGKKGFQRRRVKGESLGTQYDYNTDYVEAEVAWMTDAHAKLETEKLRRELERVYDIMPDLVRKAKDQNFETLVGGPEVVSEIRRLEAERDRIKTQDSLDKGDKIRLAQITERLDEIDPTRPATRKIAIGMSRIGSYADEESIDIRLVADLAENAKDEKLQIAAKTVLKGISERNAIIRQGVGDEMVSWEDFVPEGYKAVQPEPGNFWYKAFTIPERIMEQAEKNMLEELKLNVNEVRQVIAMGGKKPSMVVPEEIAQQLESMQKDNPSGPVGRAADQLMRSWKQWTLLGKRFFQYNVRNITGDIDPVLGGAPGVLKHASWSAKLLWPYYKGKLSVAPILKEARDLSVIDSTMASQELTDLKDQRALERFYSKKLTPWSIASAPVRSYFKFARKITNYRENILRLAAYRYYREKLKNGTLKNYGGSDRKVIEGLRKDLGYKYAAAKMARELLGDYGDMTVMGDYMRRRVSPFWAFQEINLKRYPRMVINAAQAREYKTMAGAAAVGAYRILMLGRIFALYAAFWLWNNLIFPDDESDLADYDKQNPHLDLGRNPDGTIRVFRNTGAMGDLLEWFGINSLLGLLDQYESGQITGKDLLSHIWKDPLNKFVQGTRPDIKLVAELLTGQSPFPDVLNWRTQDRGESVSNVFGLRDEYRALKGGIFKDGSRSRPNYRQRLLTGIVDPRRNALYLIYDLREKFQKKKGKSVEGIYPISPFRNLREAAMAQDYEAFLEARRDYLDKGKTYKNFKNSLRFIDPISARLNDEDEREFELEFLTSEQRAKLKVARKYAKELESTLWFWWRKASREGDSAEQQRELEQAIRKDAVQQARTISRSLAPTGKTSRQEKEQRLREAWGWLMSRGYSPADVRKLYVAEVYRKYKSESARDAAWATFRRNMAKVRNLTQP